MPKQKYSTVFYKLRALGLAVALACLIGGAAIVHADQFDTQINTLSNDSASKAGLLNGLESQANSYQQQIDQYQAQIDDIQSKLAANQSQQAQLQQQIADDQAQIAQKKDQVSAAVKAMYIDGQTSTIEELASSKDLSDYVDKEEYRNTVQNQLTDKIKAIGVLQAQQQAKKQQIDDLVTSEKAQNSQLGSDQSQQGQLLSYNEGQQSVYNQQISANSSAIAKLRQQQIAANARFSSGGSVGPPGSGPTCGGGYPSVWCNAPQDSIIDSWGMYNRECVSYTAFKVAASGRSMPYWGGRGNANQWVDDAQSAGIPVDHSPRAGDVAISLAGAFGHAMYVESVNGNGTINISQYNVNLDGRYSTNTISVGSLYFIHF
ncbi:MAG TPA: CHAP domain-containing protein [Candidatus Saccharimonadales bacterium]